jgi:chromosome segregation ATPase
VQLQVLLPASAGKERAERASALAALKAELGAAAAELAEEEAAGACAQRRIAERERHIKGLFDAYAAGQAAAAEAEDKADLLSNSLGRAADEARCQVAAIARLRAGVEQREAAVEAAQAAVDAARVRVQLEGQHLGSLEQKVGRLAGLQAAFRLACNISPVSRSPIAV